ncbi:alcohol dehydrogenase catalytic domain-containing protein [Planktothrix sp. FACHB-1355]|uniref:Alcohol dehydrogenase catalytic domain-containing protein n=1 Tax=Aerosakkonema funiforme FACHB-1375 TaxID=2949571 RepID=A0A926ZK99_9CYAN|nr:MULTISPECIES: alcohol dehydrogenase catalytic domain-containing protein [Oscillatoriales]MBD2185705.1 alcohol dehydrogenase catalytic domain-containing protein [Aerosakkonema funiforme FACHB-1375]MBD3562817.1 alcohol dehydrogenase catalytic domain-containing protein [Planktothrix sp. FACHB-1355]
MLAAVLYGQENLRLESVPDPIPGAGEVVIQVAAATTCGTDLKVWRRGGHARMLRPPTLFGHEASGRIVAVGENVSGWQVGDRVVANNSAPCMNCFFCQRQEYSLCPNLTWNNGTFAEYLKIPAAIVQHNLLSIPDDLPDALASMTEPLACVLHGVARSNVKAGDRVVVLGDGAIGLMFVAVLAHGAWGRENSAHQSAIQNPVDVFLFGGNNQRLEIGKKLGASQTFNYHQISDIPAVVKELTDGWGADVVIEATGVPAVWESAIATARPGATVNLFGGCPRDTTITVNTEQLHYSELTLKGVFHNTPTYVREALSLLSRRIIPFELLISEHRPLQDLEQVFRDMRDRKAIKVAIEPTKS